MAVFQKWINLRIKNGHISHATDSVDKTVLTKDVESETESVVSAVGLDKAKRGKKKYKKGPWNTQKEYSADW